jgi:hypothetical protein
VITDTSCEGAVTPDDYGEEFGVVDGWNDVHTATGLWQLLQVISFCVCVCARLQFGVYVCPRVREAFACVWLRMCVWPGCVYVRLLL